MNQVAVGLQYTVRTPHVLTKELSYVIVEDPKIKFERETTTLKKKLYLEVLEKTMGVTAAICQHIEISRGTFYNWMNTDLQFKNSVFQMRSDVLNDVEEAVVNKALKGNIQAAKFILSKKHPDYKQKRVDKNSVVNIYHHTISKQKPHTKTLEEVMDEFTWVNDKGEIEILSKPAKIEKE